VDGSTHEISGQCSLMEEWLVIRLLGTLNLRLGEETKGRQVEYHQIGRVRVDKKIFRVPQW
jgi:hypothetical protein